MCACSITCTPASCAICSARIFQAWLSTLIAELHLGSRLKALALPARCRRVTISPGRPLMIWR